MDTKSKRFNLAIKITSFLLAVVSIVTIAFIGTFSLADYVLFSESKSDKSNSGVFSTLLFTQEVIRNINNSVYRFFDVPEKPTEMEKFKTCYSAESSICLSAFFFSSQAIASPNNDDSEALVYEEEDYYLFTNADINSLLSPTDRSFKYSKDGDKIFYIGKISPELKTELVDFLDNYFKSSVGDEVWGTAYYNNERHYNRLTSFTDSIWGDLVSSLYATEDLQNSYCFSLVDITDPNCAQGTALKAEYLKAVERMDSWSSAKIILIAAAIILFACICILFVLCGRDGEGKQQLALIDRLYNDLHFLLYGATIAAIIFGVIRLFALNQNNYYISLLEFLISLAISLVLILTLSYGISLVRNIRNKRLIKHSLWYLVLSKLFRGIKKLFGLIFHKYKLANKVILIVTVLCDLAMLMLVLIATNIGISFEYRIAIMLAAAVLLVLSLSFNIVYWVGIDRILQIVVGISEGRLDKKVEPSGLPRSLKKVGAAVNNLSDGLNLALTEAVKGEKMKTELITNVSHDLKTPLTSIINYVELLKRDDISPTDRQKYIEVLSTKSHRLKVLIEDLTEVSKISSGNITITPVKMDLVEMIEQVVGENSDRLSQNNISVEVTCSNSVYVYADGRYSWRIIENLLSNVRKYAMPHTRAYINVLQSGDFGVVIIKNISLERLNISPEKLMERFVRGNEARSGEGSGLGLSIAQNLAELQGGKFYIDIDGDLFKASVFLPLYKDELTADVNEDGSELNYQ